MRVRTMPAFRPACAALLSALLAMGAGAAAAQQSEAEGAIPATETAPKPKPKPKPKPAPRKKPEAKTPEDKRPSAEVPSVPAAAPTYSANLPGLTVACAGNAALYDGGKGVSVWVTRTGMIAVENPLRPLTPERTRVLQVVIGGKVATAYGPDLFALRRGGSPATLEAATGAPVRWDATATALPDTLNIVSETGQPVAQLAFQSCGDAPAVQAVAAQKAKPGAAKANGTKTRAAAKPAAPKAPPGIGIPQGALQEGALQ